MKKIIGIAALLAFAGAAQGPGPARLVELQQHQQRLRPHQRQRRRQRSRQLRAHARQQTTRSTTASTTPTPTRSTRSPDAFSGSPRRPHRPGRLGPRRRHPRRLQLRRLDLRRRARRRQLRDQHQQQLGLLLGHRVPTARPAPSAAAPSPFSGDGNNTNYFDIVADLSGWQNVNLSWGQPRHQHRLRLPRRLGLHRRHQLHAHLHGLRHASPAAGPPSPSPPRCSTAPPTPPSASPSTAPPPLAATTASTTSSSAARSSPTPGAAALLGVAGLAGLRRRRA